MRSRMLRFAPLIVPAFFLFVALGVYLVMRLWNWLLPPLFGWHAVTFWQALGLLVLCRILFGGLGLHGGGGPYSRRRIIERWEAMTPEEKERFRQGMYRRWGAGPAPGPTPEA